MKRGRKKLSGVSFDKAEMIHGRNPAARCFADDVAWLAYHDGGRRAQSFRNSIVAALSRVGRLPPAEQAGFFEDVAKYLKAVDTLPHSGVVDVRRFLLRSILHIEYRNERPVDLTEVAAKIATEGGVSVDERWVSRECKKLGYRPRPRGRP